MFYCDTFRNQKLIQDERFLNARLKYALTEQFYIFLEMITVIPKFHLYTPTAESFYSDLCFLYFH